MCICLSEEQRIQNLERKAKEREIEKALPVSYPWGNNEIDRDESGKIKRRRWILEKDQSHELDESSRKYYAGVTLGMSRQGAGAPLRDVDGNVRTRVSNTNVTSGTRCHLCVVQLICIVMCNLYYLLCNA